MSGISPSFIAVTYKKAAGREWEMLLPMDQNTKLEYAKLLAEIRPGATVRVQYDKMVEGAGKQEKIQLKATKVSLLKPAVDALSSGDQP
ncbi:MAG: hypothetical protein HY597_03165 [Candidatus Omnitrophica bacterium]|nr:hypothetical protein [Candidatus Omnitrophota bacterium]